MSASRFVLETLTGSLSPFRKEFTVGVPEQAQGLGAKAPLRVEGNGVLDVHAFLFFDGAQMFVCSAVESSPVFIKGGMVPASWVPLSLGTEFQCGQVTFRFTALQDVPVATPSLAARPFERGAFAAKDTHEETRFGAPMATSVFGPNTGFTNPRTDVSFSHSHPQAVGVTQTQGEISPKQGESGASLILEKAKLFWMSAPPLRKVLILASPLVVVFFLASALHAPAPAPSLEEDEVSESSGDKGASKVPAQVQKTANVRQAVVVPSVSPLSIPTISESSSSPPSSPATTKEKGPALGKKGAPFYLTNGPKSDERLAIDALVSGQYAKALPFYEKLARERSQDPSFSEALSIVKKATGTP